MVDNSDIKYRNKKDADHLISALQEKYGVTQYWTGGLYCGITLKWDYNTRLLGISISGYLKDALQKFQHPNPTIPHHLLHQWIAPNHGSTVPQLAHPTDDSPSLNPD